MVTRALYLAHESSAWLTAWLTKGEPGSLSVNLVHAT